MEVDKKLLLETLMSWTHPKQQAFLKSRSKPIYGIKTTCAARIMQFIGPGEAIKLINAYKKTQNLEESSKGIVNMDVDFSENEAQKQLQAQLQKRVRQKERSSRLEDEDLPQKKGNKGDEKTGMNKIGELSGQEKENPTQKKSTQVGEVIEVDGESEDRRDEAGWTQVGNNTGEEDDESVATKVVSNSRRLRYGLLLSTAPSATEPDKKLILAAQNWFKVMQEVDKHFALVPWKKSDVDKGVIRKFQDIPKTMSRFRVYFSRAQVKKEGGATYPAVYIQHSMTMKEIKEDAEWKLKEINANVFNKSLQVEETVQMGWLLYSFEAMDLLQLATTISDEVGATVALRWKYINTDKYEPGREERKKWMGAHIEAGAEDVKKVARGLTRLYGGASDSFPLGIRMRLVSEYREVKGNPVNMGKHMRLRVRQANFKAMMMALPNDEIMMLDYKDKELENKSLREMVMEIKSSNPKTPGNLFHAVGQDWKGRYTFMFLKSKENEARMIADGIIPYLKHGYGSKVTSFFDPEVVAEKEDWIWDPAQKVIINPLSKQLDVLEGLDLDYNFESMEEDEGEDKDEKEKKERRTESNGKSTPEELALARMNLVLNGRDDDSVSTLGSPLRRSGKTVEKVTGQGMITINRSSPSNSIQSAMTMDSRVTALEEQITSMETSISNKMEASFAMLLARLPAVNNQPPGGTLAGGIND